MVNENADVNVINDGSIDGSQSGYSDYNNPVSHTYTLNTAIAGYEEESPFNVPASAIPSEYPHKNRVWATLWFSEPPINVYYPNNGVTTLISQNQRIETAKTADNSGNDVQFDLPAPTDSQLNNTDVGKGVSWFLNVVSDGVIPGDLLEGTLSEYSGDLTKGSYDYRDWYISFGRPAGRALPESPDESTGVKIDIVDNTGVSGNTYTFNYKTDVTYGYTGEDGTTYGTTPTLKYLFGMYTTSQ